MKTLSSFSKLAAIAIVLFAGTFAFAAYANHSWGGYHWARVANPFTLQLDDNVSPSWDSYLGKASVDWTKSSILDTVINSGLTNKNCRPTAGKVEVCNNKYGNNGWLGVAQIWISNGDHITQGTVKVNDTYFNTAYYNKSAWRQLVMCQEIGHTFGLGHQDEDFYNANLGTCMDYTSDPDGALYGQLDNRYPNAHDYEELEIIYNSHLDTFTTLLSNIRNINYRALEVNADTEINTEDPSEWGKESRKSANGKNSLYERDLANGKKMLTFVIWAK